MQGRAQRMWFVAGMQRRTSVPASVSAGGIGGMHTVGVAAQSLRRHYAADLELTTVRLGSDEVAALVSAGSKQPDIASLVSHRAAVLS